VKPRSRAAPTVQVRCDFCGGFFNAPHRNCRTCSSCAAMGAPDQSVMPWAAYRVAVRRHLPAAGKLTPLAGTAARLEAGAPLPSERALSQRRNAPRTRDHPAG
jgi:hypothetical protein